MLNTKKILKNSRLLYRNSKFVKKQKLMNCMINQMKKIKLYPDYHNMKLTQKNNRKLLIIKINN